MPIKINHNQCDTITLRTEANLSNSIVNASDTMSHTYTCRKVLTTCGHVTNTPRTPEI
jgi:hypothetical protein